MTDLVRNPLAKLWLKGLNVFLPPCASSGSLPAPRKILVSQIAHLGDLVLATAVLPVLKEAFPQVRIGFLAGSWSRELLISHPLVDELHLVDHWKLNRASLSFWAKWRTWRRTEQIAVEEIASQHYDLAVELYPYFPNAIPIFWKAGIGARLGYTSGGFAPLLTHPIPWKDRGQRAIEDYLPLLEELLHHPPPLLKPCLGPSSPRWRDLLPEQPLQEGYIVCNIGHPYIPKSWPLEKWRQLTEQLIEEGNWLVFSGKGEEEEAAVNSVTSGLSRVVNLCGKLSLQELMGLISGARLLVSIDSLAGHIASAYDIPAVILFCGIDAPHRWRPVHAQCSVLMENVPCSPCHRSRGCRAMKCIRAIGVESVLQACHHLGQSGHRKLEGFFG